MKYFYKYVGIIDGGAHKIKLETWEVLQETTNGYWSIEKNCGVSLFIAKTSINMFSSTAKEALNTFIARLESEHVRITKALRKLDTETKLAFEEKEKYA